MSSTEKIERGATAVHQVGLQGAVIDALPAEAVPATRAEAYAMQTRYAELEGQPTRGWKIAATSEAGQRHINVDGPLGGRVLADRVQGDGEAVSLSGNSMCLAEPEFVFVLGTALPPRPNLTPSTRLWRRWPHCTSASNCQVPASPMSPPPVHCR